MQNNIHITHNKDKHAHTTSTSTTPKQTKTNQKNKITTQQSHNETH